MKRCCVLCGEDRDFPGAFVVGLLNLAVDETDADEYEFICVSCQDIKPKQTEKYIQVSDSHFYIFHPTPSLKYV